MTNWPLRSQLVNLNGPVPMGRLSASPIFSAADLFHDDAAVDVFEGVGIEPS